MGLKDIIFSKRNMSITFYPVSAHLMENLDEGKNQDPYVIITIDKNSQKNQPHYHGGKTPRWDMKPLKFQLGNEHTAQFHVVDWDGVDHHGNLQDELIGSGKVDLNALKQKGQGQITEKLYWQDKYQGTITFAFRCEGMDSGSDSNGSHHTRYSKDTNNGKPRDPDEGKKIGHYVLEKFLAAGSYGRAFKSKDLKTGDTVCVKKVAKSKIKNPIEKQMFISEIKVMRQFKHPNIIRLYDLLESGSSYYLVMQLCNQGDVRQYMKKRGVTFLKEDEAVFFMKQIAMGFAELHKQKVMHRDFKTDNLFMHDSTVIIADLGFAKAGKTMTNTGCGTPIYMAPEVAEGKTYNSLVDMWSIGVTFYEILFGKFPFNGRTPDEIVRRARYYSGDRLEIPDRINRISPDAKDLLRRMLTYDPRRRISWEEFFRHRLFDEKASHQQASYNPLGSTIQFAHQMNQRFEGYRCAAPNVDHYIEEEDEINTLIQAKGDGKMQSIEIIEEEENDVDDSYFEKMIQNEKDGRENDIFEDINSRYNFEKQKIELMRIISV